MLPLFSSIISVLFISSWEGGLHAPLSYRNVPFHLSYTYSVTHAAWWHKQIRKDATKKFAFPEIFPIFFSSCSFPSPPPVLRLRTPVSPKRLSISYTLPSSLAFLMKEVSSAKVCIGRVNVFLHLGWHVAKCFSNIPAAWGACLAGCFINEGCVSHYIVFYRRFSLS